MSRAEPNILVVDDHEQNLELLSAFLEDLPAVIRTVSDGLAALQAVQAQQPDLILLDVMMPRMSGFQLCKKLKSDPATKGIGIIMVTALNEVSDVDHAKDCGADDFLTKPINRADLLARVQTVLARPGR